MGMCELCGISMSAGFMLFFLGLGLAGWNEYRNVANMKSINEAKDNFKEATCSPVMSELEGELVHVTCSLSNLQVMGQSDPALQGIPEVERMGLALQSDMEVFQWVEYNTTTKADGTNVTTSSLGYSATTTNVDGSFTVSTRPIDNGGNTTHSYKRNWHSETPKAVNTFVSQGATCRAQNNRRRACLNWKPQDELWWEPSGYSLGSTNIQTATGIQAGDYVLPDSKLSTLGDLKVLTPACGAVVNSIANSNTVWETLDSTDGIARFRKGLETVNLDKLLNTTGNFTVFAPLDSNVAQDFFIQLYLNNPTTWSKHLTKVLENHIVDELTSPREEMFNRTANNSLLQSLANETLVLDVGSQTVDNFTIAQSNFVSTNGMVHILEGIIIPSWVSQSVRDLIQDNNPSLFIPFEISSIVREAAPISFFAPPAEDLIGAPFEQLVGIWENHIFEEMYYAEQLLEMDGQVIMSKNRKKWVVSVLEGSVFLQAEGKGSGVVRVQSRSGDALANNGVLHYVDALLLGDEITESPVAPTSPNPTQTPSSQDAITSSPTSPNPDITQMPTVASPAATQPPTLSPTTASLNPTSSPTSTATLTANPTAASPAATLSPTSIDTFPPTLATRSPTGSSPTGAETPTGDSPATTGATPGVGSVVRPATTETPTSAGSDDNTRRELQSSTSGSTLLCAPGEATLQGNKMVWKKQDSNYAMVDYLTRAYTIRIADTVSVLAEQKGDTFVMWESSYDEDYGLFEIWDGNLTATEMLAQKEAERVGMTWFLRLFTLLLCVGGLVMITSPLSEIPDAIPHIGPWIGDLIGTVLWVVDCLLGCCCWSVVVSLAWIAYRPYVAIPLLCVSCGLCGLGGYVAYANHKKRHNNPGDDEVNPGKADEPEEEEEEIELAGEYSPELDLAEKGADDNSGPSLADKDSETDQNASSQFTLDFADEDSGAARENGSAEVRKGNPDGR